MTAILNINGFNLFPKVYILHENPEWIAPLAKQLEIAGVPYEEWFIHEKEWDFSAEPPQGVFFSRMSASAHTRGHRFSAEFTDQILSWLEMHGRKVINGTKALSLELSKLKQSFALNQFDIQTPRTLAGNSKNALLKLAKQFEGIPFIFKPNRGGKGTGVQLFESIESFEKFLENYDNISSPDGINLLQEYIRPADGRIVRMEFINGKFYYAVSVDTSEGFNLCPADACNNPTFEGGFCVVDADDSKFKIITNYTDNDIELFEIFLDVQGIKIGSIEYLISEDGEKYVYDINTNTNYNPNAEAQNGELQGLVQVAHFLKDELNIFAEVQQKKYAHAV